MVDLSTVITDNEKYNTETACHYYQVQFTNKIANKKSLPGDWHYFVGQGQISGIVQNIKVQWTMLTVYNYVAKPRNGLFY